ncbi:hypothetical protein DE146DRAFT_223625 [Phaeosphaeria sp. MPI-PUGE-AT-0046c]|nr:hypothetical protein DE146DRAFT_223625 [Phaeosphaeria sp. MPI-PUGE-AT-0046c]
MVRKSAGFVSKKPHRKSRGGCLTCKRKKVKCNEGQPACAYCSLRRLDCEYPPDPSKSPSSSIICLSEDSSPEPLVALKSQDFNFNDGTLGMSNWIFPAAHAATGQFTLEDFELLHHYKTSTWHTFAVRGDPSTHRLHQERVPQLSVSHPHLLYAILSVTASHRNSLQSSKHLEEKALIYRQKTFKAYTQELQNITNDNYETILITATFLLALTPPPHADAPDTVHLDWLYTLLKLSEGIRILASLRWSQGIEKLSVYPLICRELRTLPPPPILPEPALHTRAGPLGTTPDHPNPAPTYDLPHVLPFAGSVFLPPSLRALLESTLNPRDTVGPMDLHVNTLVPVFHVLSPIFLSLYYYHLSPDFNVRIFVFTSFLMPEFLALVKARESRALVLMAWFFAMADLVPHGWWVGTRIGYVVKALGRAVRESGDEIVVRALEGAEKVNRAARDEGGERAAETIFDGWAGVNWDEGPVRAQEWELSLLGDLDLNLDVDIDFGGLDLDIAV